MELCDQEHPQNPLASVSIPLTRSFNRGLFPIGDGDGFAIGQINASIIAPYDARGDALQNAGQSGANVAHISGRRYQYEPCTDMFFCEGRMC